MFYHCSLFELHASACTRKSSYLEKLNDRPETVINLKIKAQHLITNKGIKTKFVFVFSISTRQLLKQFISKNKKTTQLPK